MVLNEISLSLSSIPAKCADIQPMGIFEESMPPTLMIHICDVACQNQAFVAEMSCWSYNIVVKECNFSFHLMYYLCVSALPIQCYDLRNKL